MRFIIVRLRFKVGPAKVSQVHLNSAAADLEVNVCTQSTYGETTHEKGHPGYIHVFIRKMLNISKWNREVVYTNAPLALTCRIQ